MVRTNALFFAVTELEKMLGECRVLEVNINETGNGHIKASIPNGPVVNYSIKSNPACLELVEA